MFKSFEKILLCLSAAALVFTIGFMVGRASVKPEITFTQSENDTQEDTISTDGAVTQTPKNPGSKVNINSADTEELKTLPGIGDVMAQRIIDYRTKNGPFESLADILKVDGIGQGTYEEIVDLISIS